CFPSRRRHTRFSRDWSSDVCSSDLPPRQVDIFVFDLGGPIAAQRELGADAGGPTGLVLPRLGDDTARIVIDPDLGVSPGEAAGEDRKSTRLNSSHVKISYAVFCLKK